MESRKIIFFDFDGVFINTLPECFAINTEVNEDLTLDEYRSFFEGNIFGAKRRDGTLKKQHPLFSSLYEQKTRTHEVPVPFAECIKKLSTEHTLTVVSSSATRAIKEILARAGIGNCFADVLGSDVHSSKVVKMKSLLEKHFVKPEDAVMVTDTLGDIREANECRVKSIGVLWGWHEEETLQKGNPAALVAAVPELEVAIKKVLSQ